MRSVILALLALSACSNNGNLTSSQDLHGPTPPPIRDPYFRPNAPPGTVPATWNPPVWDEHGTIVRPRDPRVEMGRPDYDNAPWLGSNGPGHSAGVF